MKLYFNGNTKHYFNIETTKKGFYIDINIEDESSLNKAKTFKDYLLDNLGKLNKEIKKYEKNNRG